jgi:hypothetical protein
MTNPVLIARIADITTLDVDAIAAGVVIGYM